MPSTRERSTRNRFTLAAIVAGGGFVALGACGSPSNPDTVGITTAGDDVTVGGGCEVPAQGCPCAPNGLTQACKEVLHNGNYTSCAKGTLTCTGGTWGACVTSHAMFKSLGPVGGGGGQPAHPQNLQDAAVPDSGSCSGDPCDPTCVSFNDNSNGVDGGSGLAATDAGGWTLVEGGAGDSGPSCTGYQCNIPSCTGGTQTTLTGTVYDPAGLNMIYDAQVYIPAALPLPAIPVGAQMDPCGGGGNLPPSVSYAVTGPDGKFTLNNVPAGGSFPIVVQVGKWRRQFNYTLAGCQASPLSVGNLLLPSTQAQGNMPHIGLVSGDCDAMECLLLRIGVSHTEFCNPGAGCAVSFYDENGMHLSGGSNPGINSLLSSQATMLTDDLIMLPCECGSEYQTYPSSYGTNEVSYTSKGGRLFTSHWGRQWIEGGSGQWPVPYPGVANWIPSFWEGGNQPPSFLTGQINTGFAQGAAFSTWMTNVGGAAGGQFAITPWRVDAYTVGAAAQLWVSDVNNVCGGWGCTANMPADFTFNTPLGAGTTFGRVMYTDMHLSYASSQCLDNNNGCSFPSNCTNSALSGQEKAAEFLLFDLQGCTTPLPPPPPAATIYPPATFTRDFQATCPGLPGPDGSTQGSHPVWHLFSWSAQTPSNSSGASNVTFKAYTADTEAQLPAQFPTPGALGVATGGGGSTISGQTDVDTALIAAGLPVQGQPPYASHNWLRVTMTLNPTPDEQVPPTLLGWNQAYECVSSE